MVELELHMKYYVAIKKDAFKECEKCSQYKKKVGYMTINSIIPIYVKKNTKYVDK